MSILIIKKPDKSKIRIFNKNIRGSDLDFENSYHQKMNKVKVITVANEESPPEIFRLNVDCYHEIFDWLSQSDIIAIGKTCTRLQQVAGDFFRDNYGIKFARGENDGVYVLSQLSNVFSQYIRNISISGDRLGAYHFVGSKCINSAKNFRFYGTLPDGGFECIKQVLNGIDVLEMNECLIKGEFYENYFKYCPNVRELSVSRSDRIKDKEIIIGSGNDWLFQKYPKLENFELIDCCDLKNNELQIFLEQNPNVRTFSTDSRSFWENRHSLLRSNIKLDRLAIDICQSKIIDSNNQSISLGDSLYELLAELHERGFFKRLCLYLDFVNQKDLQKIFLLTSLEMVCGDILQIYDPMPNLKILGVCYGDEILNIAQLPNIIPNLERIYFARVTFDCISPFICNSAKLKQIKIKNLNDKNKFKSISLAKLNEERQKLVGERKLLIFVREKDYLAMKWTKKNLKYSLLEIRRFESFEWEELNARHRYKKSM